MTERETNAEMAAQAEQRDAEVETLIEEADAANRTAVDVLTVFMREISVAKRVIGSRPNVAETLLKARDAVRDSS